MSGHLPALTFSPVEFNVPELPDLHGFTFWGWVVLMAISFAQLAIGGVLVAVLVDLARGLLGRVPPA
jgi:hypothetical protein